MDLHNDKIIRDAAGQILHALDKMHKKRRFVSSCLLVDKRTKMHYNKTVFGAGPLPRKQILTGGYLHEKDPCTGSRNVPAPRAERERLRSGQDL
jgi:hypothetical protein